MQEHTEAYSEMTRWFFGNMLKDDISRKLQILEQNKNF